MFQIYEVEKPLCSSSHNCVGQKLPEDWKIKKIAFDFRLISKQDCQQGWRKYSRYCYCYYQSKEAIIDMCLIFTVSGKKLKSLLILLNEKIFSKENFSKMFWSVQMRKVGLTRYLCKIGCTKSGGIKGSIFLTQKSSL